MRQYFTQIPDEVRESAKIDGASEFTIWRKIMLPMAKSSMAASLPLSPMAMTCSAGTPSARHRAARARPLLVAGFMTSRSTKPAPVTKYGSCERSAQACRQTSGPENGT